MLTASRMGVRLAHDSAPVLPSSSSLARLWSAAASPPLWTAAAWPPHSTSRNSFAGLAVQCGGMLYRFESIEKSYGPHDVLQGVTWQHNPGEKVGLVGRNGAGKTTLFKLLLRQEEPDRGQIIRASALTIGHVGQHLDAEPGMSLFDYVETSFAEVLAIERKMRAIEHDL